MMTLFDKNLKLVKISLGVLALYRVLCLLIFGQFFLVSNGPLPASFVYGMSSQIILKYVPYTIVKFLPYWSETTLVFLMIHVLVLIFFILDFKAKIFIPLVILFEYSLYVRTSFLVHAGDVLFLTAIILFFVKEWLPEKSRWIFTVLWLSQGLLLYFFGGVYKDFNLWFLDGSAIQDFYNYFSELSGGKSVQFGVYGIILSRLTLFVEIALSFTLLISFFGFLKLSNKLVYTIFGLFFSIHLFSAVLFSLSTLPLVMIVFLLGTLSSFMQAKELSFKPKFIIFTVVLCFHFFPFLKVNVFPFDFFPLRQQWSLFVKPPPARLGPVIAEVHYENLQVIPFNFEETFQWKRYREYLVEEYPKSEILRKYFKNYICDKSHVKYLIWRTPHSESQSACKDE